MFTTNGAQATLSDNIAGDDNLLFKALGGDSTVNVGHNGSIETVRLNGTADNTINIGLAAGANPAGNQLTVYGLTATDVLNFAAAASSATITHPNTTTEVVALTGGETVRRSNVCRPMAAIVRQPSLSREPRMASINAEGDLGRWQEDAHR